MIRGKVLKRPGPTLPVALRNVRECGGKKVSKRFLGNVGFVIVFFAGCQATHPPIERYSAAPARRGVESSTSAGEAFMKEASQAMMMEDARRAAGGLERAGEVKSVYRESPFSPSKPWR